MRGAESWVRGRVRGRHMGRSRRSGSSRRRGRGRGRLGLVSFE